MLQPHGGQVNFSAAPPPTTTAAAGKKGAPDAGLFTGR
jgi:hypothetical protein